MNPEPVDSPSRSRRVLIVEDERIVAEDLREELEDIGYNVVGIAADGQTAQKLADEHRPEVICMDVVIRGNMDGIDTATAIRQELDIPSIFTTAYSDAAILDRAQLTNPAGFLVKPYEMATLRCTLEVAFAKIDADRKLAARQQFLEEEVEKRTNEAKELQNQLFQASKLESIGTLTGGVAHDFNNMLLPILGYAEILMDGLNEREDLYHQAEEIHRAATSASSLTRQLLAFSRSQVLERKPQDVHQVIHGCQKMIGRLLGEGFSLELQLTDEPLHALIDAGQLEQVLMNLCINGRDAMNDGGRILIETSAVPHHDEHVIALQDDLVHDWVCLTIRDEGCGMNAETVERVFEPFFSTKGQDGTGLGLSVVHGIIVQHDGEIEVHSEVGQGTTFKILLPMVQADPAAKEPQAERNSSINRLTGGTERILVIEDEPQVRIFVSRALQNKGYRVETASDIESARQLLDESRKFDGHRFDLILSDCVLPDGSGVDLLVDQYRLDPTTRAILTTGYTDADALTSAAAEHNVGFLQKPYSLDKLFEIVRDHLGEPLAMAS